MVQNSKKDYLESIRLRYETAGREHKKRILDEFCVICGHHRKHAIRLLNAPVGKQRRRPGRPPVCGEAERKAIETIWLAANRPCAFRLKETLIDWLPSYEKGYARLTPEARERLLKVSHRTLDRILTPVRRVHGSRGKCGTRLGTGVREEIPIRIEHADVTEPGTVAADTVAHCGTSMEGDFVWSLTLTDIFSGWTENRAVWNKGYSGVYDAIVSIQELLPFTLSGFHSDNGGEFLNHHLIAYFQKVTPPVRQTRGRPHHKNDNPHVEQKNFTHVRLLLGYQRIENQGLVCCINELYYAWSLFNNYFSTTIKLVDKQKVGSRYIKKYDTPKTPYRRLMDSPAIPELAKTHLTEVFTNLNPFRLKRLIDQQQREILRNLR